MTEEKDVEIPVIPAKTDETLETRMSENAYNKILPARYLKKDQEGELVEEQEDLFERVGKNVALAEAIHYDGDISLSPYHIKPGHPNRDEIIEEVIGQHGRVLLTEDNIQYADYDRFVDNKLPEEAKEEIEKRAEQFTELMEQLQFIPNTPTLANLGDDLQMGSACFVMSPTDDLEDIHETATDASLIFQSGGGVGYAFSLLRPYGDIVGSTGGVASGPLSFMRSYDQICGTIAQGGMRRGAQMGVMRVSHPDVIHFIHSKNKDVSLAETLKLNDPDDPTYTSFGEALEEARGLISDDGKVPKHLRNAVEGHLSNFNISVGVTDDFMEAVKKGDDYTFINPRTGEPHIASEETKEMYGWYGLGRCVTVGEELTVPAQLVWSRIIDGAYENGEPGVVYLDRLNDDHAFPVESTPTGSSGKHEILGVNPCGEQGLPENDVCNLAHINLSSVADELGGLWSGYNDDRELEKAVSSFLEDAIDWEDLDRRIAIGTRFLDNVVTMNDFPTEDIAERANNTRKIGLGIMGLGQLYIQLGVEYGSEVGNEVARQIMTHINQESKQCSKMLAIERQSFSNWPDSKYSHPARHREWFQRQTGDDPEQWPGGFPIRNYNTTTIAPTGTTSMIGNTTGGCEPIYNVAYYKNVSDDVQGDEMLVEFDDYFLRVLEANQIDVQAVKEEAKGQMSSNSFNGVESLSAVPDTIGELFVTADDLSGKEHASVQCALQEGVDSAISKTCNFPADATRKDMDEVYRYIHENGGKGVTVYRDGSRSKQVLTTEGNNEEMGVAEKLAEATGEPEEKFSAEEHDLPEFDELEFEEVCPKCQEGVLEPGEGCSICTNCGFSPCQT